MDRKIEIDGERMKKFQKLISLVKRNISRAVYEDKGWKSAREIERALKL